MKLLSIAILSSLSLTVSAVETQRVCHEVKNKRVCKTIKIHKKFDGKQIPQPKK